MASLREVFHGLCELCLGQRCPACGKPASAEQVLCSACWADVPRWRGRLCLRCAREGRDPTPCGRHPDYGVWPALVWEDRVAAVVHALKYQERPRVAHVLAAEMAAAVSVDPPVELITAVPLHPARERERGYNQAALLGEALSRELAIPWVPGVLCRVRATRTQTALGRARRATNVTGAFRVREAAWVKKRRMLLVDDVFTTGATLAECAALLHAAGASVTSATVSWVQ